MARKELIGGCGPPCQTMLSALVSGGHIPVATANAIRRDINGAYRAVHDPNAYDPGGFRASLGRAAAAIRRLR